MEKIPTIVRNEVIARDKGICQCCNFETSDLEMHHIIPVIKGGSSNAENIISLCSMCHRGAPNTPEEFYEYQLGGGTKLPVLLGKCIKLSIDKGYNIQEYLPKIRELIKWLQQTSWDLAIEKYGAVDCNLKAKIPASLYKKYKESYKYVNG